MDHTIDTSEYTSGRIFLKQSMAMPATAKPAPLAMARKKFARPRGGTDGKRMPMVDRGSTTATIVRLHAASVCCACASQLRWWEQQTPRHDPNSPGAVVLSDANDFNGAEHWLVVLAGCLVTDA